MPLRIALSFLFLCAILIAPFGVPKAFASSLVWQQSLGDDQQAVGLNLVPAYAWRFYATSSFSVTSVEVYMGQIGTMDAASCVRGLIYNATPPLVSTPLQQSTNCIDQADLIATSTLADFTSEIFNFPETQLVTGTYYFVLQHEGTTGACGSSCIRVAMTTSYSGTPKAYAYTGGSWVYSSDSIARMYMYGTAGSIQQYISVDTPTNGAQVDASYASVSISYTNPANFSQLYVCEWNPDTLASMGGANPCIDGGSSWSISESGTVDYIFSNTASSSHVVISAGFGSSFGYVPTGILNVDYDYSSVGFYTTSASSVATGTPNQFSKYAGLDCGGLNLVDNLKCAGIFLFYPTYTSYVFDQANTLASTTPFAYIWASMELWDIIFEGSATGTQTLTLEFHPMGLATTTLTAGTLESTTEGHSFFSSVRSWIEVFLYMMFAMGILYQALHIIGWVTGSHAKGNKLQRMKNIGKGISNRYKL